MDAQTVAGAVILGLIEGATEFIPVSSTGHLILAGHLIGFEGPPGRVFEVVIQLGAILAVCWLYRAKLIATVLHLPNDPGARRFAIAVLIAFLPAAAAGALLHGFIKGVLFSPVVVCVALIVGGIIMLVAERLVPPPVVFEVEALSWRRALGIGACQMLALIPGVSRAGATIIGGLAFGLNRRVATEFSFFLAIPTMLGAATYDLYRSRDLLTMDGIGVIAVGFMMAFLSAMLVVRVAVGFVERYGFAPFGVYRIIIGTVLLAIIGGDAG